MAQQLNSDISALGTNANSSIAIHSLKHASDSLQTRPFAGLSTEEHLLLLQLQQEKFWFERQSDLALTNNSECFEPNASEIPDSWELTRNLVLHEWQKDCVNAWFQAGKRGVLKVVTGAGKTILALAIAERLQQLKCPNLRVAIVVPTIVLLNQWQEELAAHSNLPRSAIGLMGGGHNDGFCAEVRVLICVLNSAAKKLPTEVEKAGISKNLLLIVDECHRAGSAEMKHVFTTKRTYSLGLSATPERDNDVVENEEEPTSSGETDDELTFEDSVLGQELGSVVFEMNYAEAIHKGILPPFRIIHYGLSLDPIELKKYEKLCRDITDLRNELETGSRRGLALIRWCRSRAGSQNSRAILYLSLTSERKRLLYRAQERFNAVLAILNRAFAQNPNTKAILFHESIEEVMGLFELLRNAGYLVVAEHSQFPDAMRAESLRLFREGSARVIVSARSLIEGFNVPSADLGIIVAASASVRQRVQTLGRLLRRNRTKTGAEKVASLYVLYTAGTVDELIYAKADWEQFVGAERNEYFIWNSVESSEPLLRSGPPLRPPVDESDIDIDSLEPGGLYPGNSDQGQQFSLDTQGTIRDEAGNLTKPHEELQLILTKYRRTGGRFRVTPKRRFVTKLEKVSDGWRTIFLGQLGQPLQVTEGQAGITYDESDRKPGDSYPLELVKGKVFSVLQRDKRLIARKLHGSVEFVAASKELTDGRKKNELSHIQRFLADAYARGHKISKITVTDSGHVVYVFENKAYFVGLAPEGAEGFQFESKDKASP